MGVPFSLHDAREWLLVIEPVDSPVVMIKIAVDESGTHNNAKVLCVAACLANAGEWDAFVKAWKPTADTYEKGFHSTKATPEHRALLAECVATHLRAAFVLTIAYEDFKKLASHRVKSVYAGEYGTCILACAHVLATYCDKTRIPWTAWVIEDGHKSANGAKALIRKLRGKKEFHIASHTWVGKENPLPHAADIVAYEFAASYGTDRTANATLMAEKGVRYQHFHYDLLKEATEGAERLLRRRNHEKQRARIRKKRGG